MDKFEGVALLLAVYDRWLAGEHVDLAAATPPEPVDDVTVLSCVYIADSLAATGRTGDAAQLLALLSDVPVGDAVAGEVALLRGWLRRDQGDSRFVHDLAAGRRLQPEHPGLWSLPDPDLPMVDTSTTVTDAHRATLDLLQAVFPDEETDKLHVRATGTLLRVLGQVITADGEISGFERELWGGDGELADVAATADASGGDDPVRLLWSAVALHQPVTRGAVDRFVDAIVAMARSAALVDGEAADEEVEFVNELQVKLDGAVAAGQWIGGTGSI